MTHTMIGYARCSTDKQDLAGQQDALVKLGVAADRIYTDKGFTGMNRTRPGLNQALAVVRSGDTLVVPSLTVSPGRCRMQIDLDDGVFLPVSFLKGR